MINRYLFLSTILFSFICLTSSAQELISYKQPLSIKIASATFNKDRSVKIYLPVEYDHTKIKYPVLYMLDGQRPELEKFVVATMDFSLKFHTVPAFIVVIIPQLNRGYELNPAIPGQNNSAIGGADGFLTYLTDVDLYLKKTYRTAPFNMIFGHSLGGSLATYSLIKKPELFNAYIIASPNYTFNKGFYYKAVDSLIATQPSIVRSKFIYLTAGDQWQVENNFRRATLIADTIFKKAASSRYTFKDSKGYGHNTTPTVAFVDGLSKLFANYWQGGQSLGDSIRAKRDDPALVVAAYYKQLSNWFGYELKPSLGDYQYYLGKAYLDLKDFKNAKKYAVEGLNIYPNDAELLVILGDANLGSNNKDDARKAYNKAIEASKDQELISDIKTKLGTIR